MTGGVIRLWLAASALALALSLAPSAARAQERPAGDFERGRQLLAAGDAKGARKAFEKAVKLRPDSAAAHAGLAQALLRLNKARDAERAARQAVALDPDQAEARYVLGLLLNGAGRFAEAAAEAEAAMRLRPDSPAAVLLYADALMSAFTDAGVAQARKHPEALSLDDEERKAVLARREAELQPLKTRLREAADRLDALAQANPGAAEAGRWREQAGALRLYARAGGENFGVFRQSEVTTRALITFKPEPGFTERARQNNVHGVVRLRAVLAADGSVRHILAIRTLPDGLTERCIEAARKIRFRPATVNGVPVSQYVVLEYNFNIH